jgi:hypothetical protein
MSVGRGRGAISRETARATVPSSLATQLECSLRAAVDAVSLAQADLVTPAALRQEFDRILASRDRQAALSGVLELACRVAGGFLGAFYEPGDARIALTAQYRAAGFDLTAADAALEQGAQLAVSRRSVQVARVDSRYTALAVPLVTGGPQHAAVAFLLPVLEVSDPRLVQVELVAAWLAGWLAEQSRAASEWQARTSAAIIDLVLRVERSGSRREACLVLVNEARQFLGCERIALGLVRGGAMRLSALSGTTEVNRHDDENRAIASCLDECRLRDEIGIWPAESDDQRHLLSAHRQLTEQSGLAAIVTAPLRSADRRVIGVWAVLSNQPLAERERIVRWLAACDEPIGAALAAAARPRPLAWLKIFGRTGVLGRGRWLAIVGALALLLAIPLPYRISCSCVVEPVVRRYVAAPFTGIFEKSMVKPGDLVREQQLLGRMDGREVRWELAGLEADHSKAQKSRDSNLAVGKVANAQMDRLEMDRIDQKRRVLNHRSERLEIRSPIDGVVIDGDLERSEGVPVTMGDPLFEIAPLDELVAEISVADEEVALARTEQEVEIRLDAFPGQTWTTKLERLQPRAEVRDEQNVFLGLAPLASETQELRPGMKGTATIVGPRRSLGWIVLHKPWNRLTSWLSW